MKLRILKKITVGILLIFSTFCFSASQDFFQKTFGNQEINFGMSEIETSDGDIVILGSSYADFEDMMKINLIKLNKSGELIFDRFLEENYLWNWIFSSGIRFKQKNIKRRDLYGNQVHQTSDGGYIICGTASSFQNKQFAHFLTKTNSHGNRLWRAIVSEAKYDDFNTLIPTSDKGYIICGTKNISDKRSAISLYKINSKGYFEWEKTFRKKVKNFGKSITVSKSGNYFVCGYSENDAGIKSLYCFACDAKGNLLWNYLDSGVYPSVANSIAINSDGDLIIGGYIEKSFSEGGQEGLFLKMSNKGEVLWQKTFGGRNDDGFNAVIQTSKGGYALCGYTKSYGNGLNDIWLVKTDYKGEIEWQKTFGGRADDLGNSLEQCSDEGFVIAGETNSLGSGWNDIYVIKTNKNGNAY